MTDTFMIENELDVLRDVSHRLEEQGIEFMLTGSVAMNYYAQPRMTRDQGRQRDVRNLLTPECDMAYLRSRATSLGVIEDLESLNAISTRSAADRASNCSRTSFLISGEVSSIG
jgi:hypothetical protein